MSKILFMYNILFLINFKNLNPKKLQKLSIPKIHNQMRIIENKKQNKSIPKTQNLEP